MSSGRSGAQRLYRGAAAGGAGVDTGYFGGAGNCEHGGSHNYGAHAFAYRDFASDG